MSEYDDIYGDLGGGDSYNGSAGDINDIYGVPGGDTTYADGTTVFADGSSEGYGADGSYWYQGADGSSYYKDADGATYYSDDNGNWWDGSGNPVAEGSSGWSKIKDGLKGVLKNMSMGSGGSGGPGGGSALGRAAGNAATAAGNNRLTQEQLALEQERINLEGGNDYETQLMRRAQQEQALKTAGFRDIDSTAALESLQNRVQNPRVSPFDPTGGPKYSDAYKSEVATDVNKAQQLRDTPNIYSASRWTPLKPFTPIDLTKLQQATGTASGTLENIGNWSSFLLPWLDRFLPSGGSGGGGNAGGRAGNGGGGA